MADARGHPPGAPPDKPNVTRAGDSDHCESDVRAET